MPCSLYRLRFQIIEYIQEEQRKLVMFNRITVNFILPQDSLFSQRCYIRPIYNEETRNVIRFWWNVPPAVVLLTSNLPTGLMAVYGRRAVSQGILYIRVPTGCFRSSLTLRWSRITEVNDFAYINVLTIYNAPLCFVMLLNTFSFSVLSSDEN